MLLCFVGVAAVMAVAAAAPMGTGMIMYFDAQSCPDGWQPYTAAQGRVVVSVADAGTAGVTVGTPLKDREDRAHTHTYTSDVVLPQKDIAAIGCCNDQGAQHGVFHQTGPVSGTASGLPFAQYVLCHLPNATSDLIIPFGTVVYFDPETPACPANWVPFTQATGRVLVPAYKEGGTVVSLAAPLKSGEDRQHNHAYDVTFQTDDVSYAGAEGCCNSGTAASGTVHVAGTSALSSLGIPYIQLLTCQSVNPTFNSTLPGEALVWNSVNCPPAYNLSFSTAGRFLVVLPEGGLAGATFGGNSLSPDGQSDPAHGHTVSGSISTSAAGVGLASGCCGSGYAKQQEYSYSGGTAAATTEFPYIMAPLCQRNANLTKKQQFLAQQKQQKLADNAKH